MSDSTDSSTAPKAEPLEYNLTIRALPSSVPTTIRLRALLKSILRRFEFRCTSIRELNTATDASAADNPRQSKAGERSDDGPGIGTAGGGTRQNASYGHGVASIVKVANTTDDHGKACRTHAKASEGTGQPEGRTGAADAPECGVGPLEKVPRYSGGGSRRNADVLRASVSQAIASNSK